MTGRELGESAVLHQAQALRDYLERPGNRGASAWLDGRDFAPVDRALVLRRALDLMDAVPAPSEAPCR